jgi:hypothetical protein
MCASAECHLTGQNAPPGIAWVARGRVQNSRHAVACAGSCRHVPPASSSPPRATAAIAAAEEHLHIVSGQLHREQQLSVQRLSLAGGHHRWRCAGIWPIRRQVLERLERPERVIDVSHRTMLTRAQVFGPLLAAEVRRRRRVGRRRFVDEVFLFRAGEKRYLYRAVDEDGVVVDVLLRA